jgi:hypothetical protein
MNGGLQNGAPQQLPWGRLSRVGYEREESMHRRRRATGIPAGCDFVVVRTIKQVLGLKIEVVEWGNNTQRAGGNYNCFYLGYVLKVIQV